jgi:TRAP-type uncharacterized transport system substrate-binding protein
MRVRRVWISGFLIGCLSGAPAAWAQSADHGVQFAQAQQRNATPRVQPNATTAAADEADIRSRINNWAVTILGGYNTGVLIRMAVDIQTAFEDGDNLRILPVVSHGAKQNVLDLLYLKGADIAITHADVFEELKKEGSIRNIEGRVQYISQLHLSGVHVLVRPEIKSLKDLEGKKVGFHGVGSGVDATASIIFPRLGIKAEKVNVPNQVGLEKMKTGELAGLVHLLTRRDAFLAKIPEETGFHLLNIEYDDRFIDYYTPYTIESSDYPNLIKPGEKVETLGVPAVLAVYNWPRGSERFRRVERFIQYYFSGFEKLKQPLYQADWKTVNLAAKVSGWTRFGPAEEALAKLARNELSPRLDPWSSLDMSAELSDPKRRQLFDEFLEWKRQQGKQINR